MSLSGECPEGNPEGLELLRESLRLVEGDEEDSSHVFVVLGASGDLARKKIYPTLWALYRDSLIPGVGYILYILGIHLVLIYHIWLM